MAMTSTTALSDRISTIRAFNRFYTPIIGVLREGLLQTPFSLTEARVIFELAQRDELAGSELRSMLDLDAGYLSRVLSRLEAGGLIVRERATTDARRQIIRLTAAGRAAF